MESRSRLNNKELLTRVGGILQLAGQLGLLLLAANLEGYGVPDGVIIGGHGVPLGDIIDDVLAALPPLGRNDILPKIEEFASESPAN